MRKISLLLMAVVFFSGCLYEVKGSGVVVSESRDVAPFNNINTSGDFILNITQSATNSLTIAADDNIQEYIKSEVSDGTLKVYIKNGVNLLPSKGIVLNVSISDFESLDNSGAVTVKSQNTLSLGNLLLNLSGSSELSLNLNALNVTANMSGATSLDFNGNISNKLKITLSGTGSVESENCPSKSAEISISGSGDARINVIDSLSVNIAGSGNIYYKGSPVINKTISGTGSVTQIQ